MKKHLVSTSHADIIQHNFWVPCFFSMNNPRLWWTSDSERCDLLKRRNIALLDQHFHYTGVRGGQYGVCVGGVWGGWLVRSHLVTQTTAGDEVDESPYSVWLTAEVGGDCDTDSSWKSRRGEKKERERKKNNLCHIASHPLTLTFVNNQ